MARLPAQSPLQGIITMSQPRRQFLRLAGAAAAVLAFGRTPLATASAAAGNGFSSFAPRVGRTFRVSREGGPAHDLVLAKAVPLANAKGYPDERKAREQCFTLVFRSAEASDLAEGVYAFDAPGVRSFEAYMSPINGDGRSYQVVFNRT